MISYRYKICYRNATKGQLSCPVEHFTAIIVYTLDESRINLPLNLKYSGKIVREMGPLSRFGKEGEMKASLVNSLRLRDAYMRQ